MTSNGSTPSERIDTRFSTPAPELDDHRPRARGRTNPLSRSPTLHRAPEPRLDLPALNVEEPSPAPTPLEPQHLLQVDEALRLAPEAKSGHSIARDFEVAVSDGSDDEAGISPAARRASGRRETKRGGRPREFRQVDRSRDTSSSRSTSPANSIEAFAEPRRRQRANTAGSLPDSVDLARYRAGSYTETQRPAPSTISIPGAIQSRTHTAGADHDTGSFLLDEEPGNTYKIDFEELEEFVALCKQGKIALEPFERPNSDNTQVFHDQRPEAEKHEHQNVALNGEHFYEKPLERIRTHQSHHTAATESSQPKSQPVPSYKDRFTFFSSDLQHARCANTLAGFVKDGTKFQDLFDVGPEGGGVWWLDVLNPTKAELDVLASAFRIHRLTKEDIETQEPREKVELFSQYYFVCFRSFNMNALSEDFLDPIHLYIIVTADGVLSFSYTSNPHARNVRRRISKLGDFLSLGPDYICYALIDDIVDSFAPIIRNAEIESENIEDQVFIARDEDFGALLRQIGEARKRVLNMMRLLGGKADVIKGFAKRCNEQFEMTPRGDIGLYLGDIQDHVVTMMSNLGHVEKMLSRSHANYLAQLNVDHLLKGNSTNKSLAKITVVATILVPLNLVTGLFGMNVHVPGQDVPGFYWFGGIIGVIALFITTSVILAKRMKLI